jgi:hypothetical protein
MLVFDRHYSECMRVSRYISSLIGMGEARGDVLGN